MAEKCNVSFYKKKNFEEIEKINLGETLEVLFFIPNSSIFYKLSKNTQHLIIFAKFCLKETKSQNTQKIVPLIVISTPFSPTSRSFMGNISLFIGQ